MSAIAVNADRFPKKLLIAIGLMLAFVLSIVTWMRMGATGIDPVPAYAPIVERSLRFEDRADGSILVRDAQSNTEIAKVLPGTNGFLRSTMRGLARERKRREIGSEPPFLLAIRTDGRLSLGDPATGRYLDLDAFGPTNADVFRHFLSTNVHMASDSPGVAVSNR